LMMPAAHADAPFRALQNIARRYGTPTYAYDITRLREQAAKLKNRLPDEIEFFYSLKANPSLGLCGLLASWGFGADVASAGELLIALTASFPPSRILVGGPYKSPETFGQLDSTRDAMLSIDSVSELEALAKRDGPRRALLRLRPDFDSRAVVNMGPDSRFGIPFDHLNECRRYVHSGGVTVVGFHVFSGSQMLDPATVVQHLRGAAELSLRAADLLRVAPEILNLGGGFGIPYGPHEQELELDAIAEELKSVIARVSPARVILELGRYLVAQSGWYLTTVVARQVHADRRAVVVDGGTHQRADLCGLGLRTGSAPPVVLSGGRQSPTAPTDVLGCLCLPDDVLIEASPLPALSPGDILAFPNAGAYGLSASPSLFLGHPAPAEVAFAGEETELLRARMPCQALLTGQNRAASMELKHLSNHGPDS
jgi:diaminopimelate decarboxylase